LVGGDVSEATFITAEGKDPYAGPKEGESRVNFKHNDYVQGQEALLRFGDQGHKEPGATGGVSWKPEKKLRD